MLKLKTDGTVYLTREGEEVTLQLQSGKCHKFLGSNGYYYGENGGLYSDGGTSAWDIVSVKVNAHPHAESMLEYAKDAATTDKPWLLWEYTRAFYNGVWHELDGHPSWLIQCQYRRKPKQKPMIKIGEFTVPQPMKVKPELNQTYFVLVIGSSAVKCTWYNDSSDNEFFNNGRCYETREEAEQVGKALVSLLTQ